MKQHRNSEPAVLDEESLNLVRQVGLAARALAAARVTRPADLTDAVAVGERALRFLEIELPVGVDECVGFLLPHAHHLRGLFLERHPREEVGSTLFGGRHPPGAKRRRICCNIRQYSAARTATKTRQEILGRLASRAGEDND